VVAAGNIVNDLYDIKRDLINKPRRQIVGSLVSLQKSWYLYVFFVVCGLVFTSILAYISISFILIVYYFLFTFLLWLYSYRLKCSMLIGNIVVSFLCASVIASPVVVSYDEVAMLSKGNIKVLSIIGIYVFFAFMLNFIRELIKDTEDLKGDQTTECKSTAVVFGAKSTLKIASTLSLFLTCVCIYLQIMIINEQNYLLAAGLLFLVMLPLVIIFLWLKKENKSLHKKSDRLLKLTMVFGILLMATI
jgi:4-hydroxybenzoate polyprenyltransferase